MSRTHRKNKELTDTLHGFFEDFEARFDRKNPKPRSVPDRPRRPDLPEWPDRKDYYYTQEIGGYNYTRFDTYKWRQDTSVIARERNEIIANHEREVARFERKWGKVIEAHSARLRKFWDEWFTSPERAQRDAFWESMPRLRRPWTSNHINDGHLYGYGARPEGARRDTLLPNLAREYMRTHEAIEEYLDGAKDPICLDCGSTLREAEFMVCSMCKSNDKAEAWDDQPEYPDDWSFAYEENDDLRTQEIITLMGADIVHAHTSEEAKGLLS